MTVYLTVVLWIVFFMSLYLFTSFFVKVIRESFVEEELPAAPEGLKKPLILAVYSLTFLSIATYSIFMLGIHKLNTRLMIPWALVIGFKCVTGGLLLIYCSNYVDSWSLLQAMFFYSTTVISFIGIYYCYLKIVVVRKIVDDRKPILDNISIISSTDEKPKTIV